jgi:23S rRNA pseudouridine2605 synthase
MADERLQKILAHAGIASRRKAEQMMLEGRVELNGKIVRELGTKADLDSDIVRVDGKQIREAEDKVWLVLYKPAGCVTTLSDPEGRPTIKQYVEHIPERVYPVGRLDYDAEGALIVTNDGELAHQLMHPRYGVRRTYLAKVHGVPTPEQIENLTKGMRLEDGRARALEAELHSRTPKNSWVRVVVSEGRPHLVKRLMEAVGAPVQKLYRADYGGITVQGLRPGEVRELTRAEVEDLRAQFGKKATAEEPRPGSGSKPGRSKAKVKVAMPARRHGHGPPLPRGRKTRGRAKK